MTRFGGQKAIKKLDFYCSLEKNCSAQKYISNLIIKDSLGQQENITSQERIEDEIRTFFMNLYKNHDDYITINNISDFYHSENKVELTEQEANEIEGEITLEELTETLKKTSNNSTPGYSGFSYAFYKLFWSDLKFFILNSANYSFISGQLPVSQRMGIISLLPKGNKPKNLLTNWRPITLLNCIYKLISGAIASRINKVLPKLIYSDQSGFVKGRYIGEPIRTTYDTLWWAKSNKKIGLLLLIAFWLPKRHKKMD